MEIIHVVMKVKYICNYSTNMLKAKCGLKCLLQLFCKAFLMDSNEESGNGVTLLVHFNVNEMRLSLTRALAGKKSVLLPTTRFIQNIF